MEHTMCVALRYIENAHFLKSSDDPTCLSSSFATFYRCQNEATPTMRWDTLTEHNHFNDTRFSHKFITAKQDDHWIFFLVSFCVSDILPFYVIVQLAMHFKILFFLSSLFYFWRHSISVRFSLAMKSFRVSVLVGAF